MLKSFTIYYTNIRDLKSKRSSFEEIVAELKPTMIAVTETWIDKDYKLDLDGYEPFRNDRNDEGGGIYVGVRKELKYITTEVKKTKDRL